MNLTYIIAEAGINHNGSLEMAIQLIDAAVRAGADAVKFQTFKAENLVTSTAPKAKYQKENTDKNECQQMMLKKYELDFHAYEKLFTYCRRKKIDFLSSPFDVDSLNFLSNEFGLETIKLGSGEITNSLLLLKTAQLNKNVILSTGMSTLKDIKNALGVLAFGYLNVDEKPSLSSFKNAYHSDEGKACLKKQVSLLHCTTAYPTPCCDVNLRAMEVMRKEFNLPVGYSDHTRGINIAVAAVACGAEIIEKHFTLDRNLPGPDQKASLEPAELTAMIKAIREIEQAMGKADKFPTEAELENIEIARRSLVALTSIKKGEKFTKSNLGIKRPGHGISGLYYWDFLDTLVSRNYEKDEAIKKA